MRGSILRKSAAALVILAIAAILLYQLPPVKSRLSWRLDAASTYVRGVINPVQPLPTPHLEVSRSEDQTPTQVRPEPSPPREQPKEEATPAATPRPSPTPTPPPEMASLISPEWEKQDWNNCGPATMSLYLKYYGWEGDQFEISDQLKPERADRNVNVEELVHFTRNRAGWLNTEFRVGGTIEQLKRFIAAGIPVMIEEGFVMDTEYWPNDDGWAGHYLLLTGYDDAAQAFTAQDTFIGADREVAYETLDGNWRAFNRVFILLYPPDQESVVKEILGPHWDVEYNRQQALETAQTEIDADRDDGFAWFNLGTNLVYFEQYSEAARAFDQARTLDLPQRMLRYQFGPFFAYFHTGQTEDLLALTEYALQRTPNSEEALLWNGWGLYRQGDINGAVGNFRAALEANRFYQDALYALEFVSSG